MSRGQALVFFALVLPAVLLPVAAFAAETSIVAQRQARLSEATALAATSAALALDTGSLRAGSGWRLDPVAAGAAARGALAAGDPAAVADSVATSGEQVTVSAHEPVRLLLTPFLAGASLNVRARATARLSSGFGAPPASP